MSHFTVAVVTAVKPTQEVLTAVLQPFHEFECTGVKDQYVVPVDETDQKQRSYQEEKFEAVFKDGAFLESKYADQFEKFWKRESEFGRSSSDEFILPEGEGYELKVTPVKDVWTFEDYLKKWEGYSLDGNYSELTSDGKFLRYTNPNKTWDWWTIGGRWSNSLLAKSGKKVDSCMIGELDFDTRIAELKAKANEHYDFFEKCLVGCIGQEERTWRSWKEIRNDDSIESIEDKRAAYGEQKAITTIHQNDAKGFFSPFIGHEIDDFRCSRDEYVEAYSKAPFQCYNMLIAAEANTDHMGWYGGEMGWFGMGNQQEDWGQTYQDLLRSQPKEHYITVIDCHI